MKSSGSKVCIATMNGMFRSLIFRLPAPKGSSPAWSSDGGDGIFCSSPEKGWGGGGGGIRKSLRGWHFIPERQLFVVLKLGNESKKMYNSMKRFISIVSAHYEKRREKNQLTQAQCFYFVEMRVWYHWTYCKTNSCPKNWKKFQCIELKACVAFVETAMYIRMKLTVSWG